MNQDQVLSIVRWVISTGSGYFVGKGLLTADQVTMIGAAAAALVPLAWSFFIVHKTPAA